MLLINILYFAISCIALIASGIFLVKSLTKIARFLQIPEFSAAFIIMAFATSIPELFVGISSALAGSPQLSLGNVLGANVIDLTLITGILVLFSGKIKIETEKIGKDDYFMLATILLIIVLYIMGDSLSRIDGAVLLLFFAFSTARKIRKRKKFKRKLKSHVKRTHVIASNFIFIVSLIALFLSSHYVVKYASNLAIDLNLPKIIIGLFILSIATTLPELVFGISAVRLKHKAMGIGDIVGSIVTNSTLVLGIVALISPITTELLPFLTSAIFLFIAGFIFVTFIRTGGKLERIEGISLILIYVLFVIIEFFIK